MIELDGVRFSYGSHTVLAGLSGTLGPGVAGLVGLNGAGKTTLLRLLATVTKPDSGRLVIDGAEVAKGSARKVAKGSARKVARARLGYLPQAATWDARFTVREMCHYFAWLHGVHRNRRNDLVEQALGVVDLTDLASTRLRALSGGQHRRAMIAQALAHDPELLILDEPTAGLDPAQRVGFRQLVADLGQTRTVVVSTHLIEDVALAADQVAVLHQGWFVFNGSVADLKSFAPSAAATQSPLEQAFHRVISEQASV